MDKDKIKTGNIRSKSLEREISEDFVIKKYYFDPEFQDQLREYGLTVEEYMANGEPKCPNSLKKREDIFKGDTMLRKQHNYDFILACLIGDVKYIKTHLKKDGWIDLDFKIPEGDFVLSGDSALEVASHQRKKYERICEAKGRREDYKDLANYKKIEDMILKAKEKEEKVK